MDGWNKKGEKIINNYFFWLVALVLIFIIISNFYSIFAYATGLLPGGNTQIGARIEDVSYAGCQLPPPTGTGPDPICVAAGCPPNPATNGVLLIPYGYSAPSFCPMVTMPTTNGNITVANVGFVLLGLFTGTVIGTPAVPLGIVGMALQ